MSKNNDAGSGEGFLSRMVKLVTSQDDGGQVPDTNWSDLESDSDRQSGESRHALKKLVERKRQCDDVRNREFDMLRKLRRQGGKPASARPQPAGAPSPAQKADDERDRTLKKIDEIEAQMAASWFNSISKRSNRNSKLPPLRDEGAKAPRPQAFAPTVPMERIASPAPAQRPKAATRPAATPAAAAAAPAPTAPPPAAQAPAAAPPAPRRAVVAFDGLEDFNVEVSVKARQAPEIEDAAILFANGDPAGAEAALVSLLADGHPLQNDLEAWLTLFDLYRASGEQPKFDGLAANFAARFGRSAPQWAVVSQSAHIVLDVASAAAPLRHSTFTWSSPSTLGTQSVATLNASIKRVPAPWTLNWRGIKAIDPAAVDPLTETLKSLAEQPVRLKFLGADVLRKLLEEKTPTEDRGVPENLWQARLALLRLLGNMEEFDQAALDYCVTYEVSPPAWEPPKCDYAAATEEGYTVPPSTFGEDDQAAEPPASTQLPPQAENAPDASGTVKFDIKGDLLDSAAGVLQGHDGGEGVHGFEVNCRQLRRADFAAAGDLLNWALTQKAENRFVTFKQVNRLVAAFFGVLGLHDAATIMLRTD